MTSWRETRVIRHRQFYIDGQWVDPVIDAALDVINPATEFPFAQIAAGGKADFDRAVAAAKPDRPVVVERAPGDRASRTTTTTNNMGDSSTTRQTNRN